MRRIGVAVIGAGRVGATRAVTCARSGLVDSLWIVDRNAALAAEVAAECGEARWVTDYREIPDDRLDAVMVSAAPETTHYPISREFLAAGKHVLVEKPMALTLAEADDLVAVAEANKTHLTVGFTQRFNPKYAYIKDCLEKGALGNPVTALFSRHLERGIASTIASRGDLGPAEISTPHAIDLLLWWMSETYPVRVYAQAAYGVLRDHGVPDALWMIVTMADGANFTIGCNWNLPSESPRFSTNYVEFVGTDGAITSDETHRDLLITTEHSGLRRPLATMPGEQVRHVYQGPMEAETRAFVEAIASGRQPLVTAREGRNVMEVALAADMSARSGEVVALPLPTNETSHG